jgi:hypothetical protein
VSRVVLVVADHADLGPRAAAREAALALGAAGSVARVVVVTGDELVRATWSHRVGAHGRVHTRIGLRGATISDDDVAGVVFRSQAWTPALAARGASAGDAAYARAELTALLTSWLASLGRRVANACEGTSTVGPVRRPQQWRRLAAQTGLPSGEGDAVRRVLVAGSRVVGAGGEEADRCLALAESAGCRLLEVSFTASGAVGDVSVVPPLVTPAHVAATAALLEELAA